MRGGIVLIVVGLLLGFLAVSGRICCLTQMATCITSDSETPCQCGQTQSAQTPPTTGETLRDLLKDLELPDLNIFPYF